MPNWQLHVNFHMATYSLTWNVIAKSSVSMKVLRFKSMDRLSALEQLWISSNEIEFIIFVYKLTRL